MHRRLLVLSVAAWPAVRLAAQPRAKRPHRRIPASQLLEALSGRFPLRFAVPGLMELELDGPALLLLPARNKLGATLRLEARSPALPDKVAGDADVLFALRYEPTDRTVRARDPELRRLQVPGLTPEAARPIEIGTRALLSRMAGEIVLHRLTDGELALPDVMGLEPGSLVVQEDGLDIEFVPKGRP